MINYGTTCISAVNYNGVSLSQVNFNGTCVFPDEPAYRVLVTFCPLSAENSTLPTVDFTNCVTLASQPIIQTGDFTGVTNGIVSITASNASNCVCYVCHESYVDCTTVSTRLVDDSGYCWQCGCSTTCTGSGTCGAGSYSGILYDSCGCTICSLSGDTVYCSPALTVRPASYGGAGGHSEDYVVSESTRCYNCTQDPDTGVWTHYEETTTVCRHFTGCSAPQYVGSCTICPTPLTATVSATYCGVTTKVTRQLTSSPQEAYLVWAEKVLRYTKPTEASCITETVTSTTTSVDGYLNLGTLKIASCFAYSGACIVYTGYYGLNYECGEIGDETADDYDSNQRFCGCCTPDAGGWVHMCIPVHYTWTHTGNPNKRDIGVCITGCVVFADQNGCRVTRPICGEWNEYAGFITDGVWSGANGSWTGTVTCCAVAQHAKDTAYASCWYNYPSQEWCAEGHYGYGING